MMKNKKKLIIPIIAVLFIWIWTTIAYTDYQQVGINWNKPNFCILINGVDDGGSGHYRGLGYSFDIDGELDADKGYQVDSYTFKVLGITIKEDKIHH